MKLPKAKPATIGRATISLTEGVIAAVIETIRQGWSECDPKQALQHRRTEVALTEELRRGMRLALRRLPWRNLITVLPGTEWSSTPDQPAPDGITDIPLLLLEHRLVLDEHDPHVIIECKRLRGADAALARLYVTEGIDRFAAGRYGGNHQHGFMCGYLESGSVSEAVARINDFLESVLRPKERLESVSPGHHQSEHPRPVVDSIRLHHVMLVV